MTIATVLRSGGDFTPQWVKALHTGLNKWAPVGYVFRVLTDMDLGIWGVPLKHNWPGWWSKVELFRPDVFDGPVLYMDLDTLPVGDLSDLCGYEGPDLMALRDLYTRTPDRIGSGVMAWTPNKHTAEIYERFTTNPPKMAGRLDHVLRTRVQRYVQDEYPGQVVSLKPKGRLRQDVPVGTRLVCGHGHPRLSSPAAGWAHEEWKRRAA